MQKVLTLNNNHLNFTKLKITASDVNKLRKSTGAGMMDCKKALEESNGDFDIAIEVLRKKGQKVAANRADRDSSEGVVLAKVNTDNTSGIIISLNCETDFVAKNDDYVQLAQKMADHALNFSDKESFLDSDFDGMKVSEKLLEQTGVIGEKIEIGSFEYISANFVGSYIHAGNKIASIVGLSENPKTSLDKVTFDDANLKIANMNNKLLAIEKRASLWNVPQKPATVAAIITIICIMNANPRLPVIIYHIDPSSGETMNVRRARAIRTP